MALIDTIRSIRMEPYDYSLDDARIAKFPVEPRDASQLLLYKGGELSHTHFNQLPHHLPAETLLVYNNTRVIHARLLFKKETGAQIELFCLEPLSPSDYALAFQATGHCDWMCFIGNLKRWKQGTLQHTLTIKGQPVTLTAERAEAIDNAHRVRFTWSAPVRFGDILEAIGQMPIPPYLNREAVNSDETNYQTVYSKIDGSVAAPTAGLHFTPAVLEALDDIGVQRREVTLHVGAGTFKPVQSDQLSQHSMHAEFITVERSLIEDLIAFEGRITAVGTTSVRTLESLYWFGHQLLTNADHQPDEWVLDQWYAYTEAPEADQKNNPNPTLAQSLNALLAYMDKVGLQRFSATTRLLIAPGYTFRVVNTLITNFHQPKSTLLLLVSAFLGGERWKTLYNYALEHDFRFLSYGDSSLLMP
jgi:S-adenosylmethionine:tRNA ribosyltransferase-isomerase